ncbi:MAG: hypothetical protein EF806_05005 [Candidatus Methanoliparum thermophilum]|uniref:SCP2 domain-containing protein n=1 Tax=Methanoliparum thermophilum TaxID=2491083 RepID=A0A520KRH0_METT2|nr:MAG: hypothetical protein EF806_05005 [Candidatus Methanoliparum thermophilum]
MNFDEESEKLVKKIDTGKIEPKDMQEFVNVLKKADIKDIIKFLNNFPDFFIKSIKSFFASTNEPVKIKSFISPLKDMFNTITNKMEDYGVKEFVTELSKPELIFPGMLVAGGIIFKYIDIDMVAEFKEDIKELLEAMFSFSEELVMPIADKVDELKNAIDNIEFSISANFDIPLLNFTLNIKGDRKEDRGILERFRLEKDPNADVNWIISPKGLSYFFDFLISGGSMDDFFKMTASGEIELIEDDLPGAGLIPLLVDLSDICKDIYNKYL